MFDIEYIGITRTILDNIKIIVKDAGMIIESDTGEELTVQVYGMRYSIVAIRNEMFVRFGVRHAFPDQPRESQVPFLPGLHFLSNGAYVKHGNKTEPIMPFLRYFVDIIKQKTEARLN